MTSVLEIVSSAVGLCCVFLAGRNKSFNFWVGYVYNVLLFILFMKQHLYAAMILQPVSFGINLYGHIHWTHPKKEETSSADGTSLKVSGISAGQLIAISAALVILAIGLGFYLQKFTGDPSPWLDSSILATTFMAQFLSARKCWECWIVWIVVNIANIILYISSGLVFMPIVSGLYLVNGLWSLVSWKKLYNNNQ